MGIVAQGYWLDPRRANSIAEFKRGQGNLNLASSVCYFMRHYIEIFTDQISIYVRLKATLRMYSKIPRIFMLHKFSDRNYHRTWPRK